MSLELLSTIPRFGMLIGIALLGASSFWGAIFVHRARLGKKDNVFETFSFHMVTPLLFGLSFLVLGYWTDSAVHYQKFVDKSFDQGSMLAQKSALFSAQFPVVILLLVTVTFGLVLLKRDSKEYFSRLQLFFATVFAFSVAFAVTPLAVTVDYAATLASTTMLTQIFLFGTVTIIGHLYFHARKDVTYSKGFFRVLHQMAKFVWLAIAVQVFVSLFAPESSVVVNDALIFSQILLGALVLVAVVATGPFLKKIVSKTKINNKMDHQALGLGAIGYSLISTLLLMDVFDLSLWNLQQLFLGLLTVLILAGLGVLIVKYDR